MSLQVHVISATDVPNPEKFGKCDPYAAVEFQGKRACRGFFFSPPFNFLDKLGSVSDVETQSIVVMCVERINIVQFIAVVVFCFRSEEKD